MLTFKQIVSYVYDEIPDLKDEFEQKFISLLHAKSNLMQMRMPLPIDYAQALLECSRCEAFPLSKTLVRLISDFHVNASTFIIPNKHHPNIKDSPKATPTSKPKGKITESATSVSKRAPPACSRDGSTRLSAKKSKILTQNIKDTELKNSKLYSACKTDSCKEVCPKIVRTAPITECTHPNPHPGGVYPHVSRKVIRKVHKFKDYTALLTLDGIPNPLNVQTSAAGSAAMDVEVARVSKMNPVTSSPVSKKRKVSEETTIESQWQWVGKALRADSNNRTTAMRIMGILNLLDAPVELKKTVQKWETLSEAERMKV